ncbi:MAG: type II secretion system protein GspK [Propionivibrio sp.]
MSPQLPARRRQRGMALITAILIAALVASLAFALSARERLWLTQLGNRDDLAAAQSTALSAIDLARLTLRDDMRNNQVDHLLEAWTVPVPPINVEAGRVGGRLVELQGRLNLYTLQRDGKVSAEGVLALQRLLSTQNLPSDWAGQLAAALAAQVTLWQEAKKADAAAARLTSKLLPAAGLAELAALAGLSGGDAERLAAFEPFTVLLPEATSVNVELRAAGGADGGDAGVVAAGRRSPGRPPGARAFHVGAGLRQRLAGGPAHHGPPGPLHRREPVLPVRGRRLVRPRPRPPAGAPLPAARHPARHPLGQTGVTNRARGERTAAYRVLAFASTLFLNPRKCLIHSWKVISAISICRRFNLCRRSR